MKLLPLTLALVSAAFAQLPNENAVTRAGEIEAARNAKAASIPATYPEPGKAGAMIGGLLGRLAGTGPSGPSSGFSVKLGGLAVGSGIALGPRYTLVLGNVYEPKLVWETFAVGSVKGYYRIQSGFEFPRLFGKHAFFGASGLRFDYPQLSYYGEGPESRKTGESNYRMQDNSIEMRAGGEVFGTRVRVGLLGGYQNIVIRPGTAPDKPDAQDLYPATGSLLAGRQANYLSGGFFARYEGRDVPGDPHAGTYLLAQFQNINGSSRAYGGFNQYDFEVQQYIHFWNKRRVIALRGKSSLTTPHAGSVVPFYLEPRLGTSEDLRGFRPYRFYDQNSVVATAEYRFAVWRPLEMALFADAGKVYHNADQFSLARISADVGIGLRARAGSSVPFRLDIGVSREGAQVWLVFHNVF